METIIPEKESIEYLKKLELKDMLPKSLDIEKKHNMIDDESESMKFTIGFHHLKFNQNFNVHESPINCIYSIKNLLLIACNEEIKIYDIPKNYELYASIKIPEKEKSILCVACSEIDDILYCAIGGEFSSIHVIDVLSFEELTGHQLIGHKNKVVSIRISSKKTRNIIISWERLYSQIVEFKKS